MRKWGGEGQEPGSHLLGVGRAGPAALESAHPARGAPRQGLGLVQPASELLVRGGTPAQDVHLGGWTQSAPCSHPPHPHQLSESELTSPQWPESGFRMTWRLRRSCFTFRAQRGSARAGHRRTPPPLTDEERSGARPRTALRGGGHGRPSLRPQATLTSPAQPALQRGPLHWVSPWKHPAIPKARLQMAGF